MFSKNTLAIATTIGLAALTSSTQAADQEFKIYGKANLTLEQIDDNGDTLSEVNSNASRIGAKGSKAIDEGIDVIYQMEWEVDLDGDADQTFKQRGSYIGLKGAFGKVIAGIHDTPTKMLAKKTDLFNDLTGDLKHAVAGETRAKNMLMYTSPTFSGVTINIMPIQTESSDEDKNSLFDSVSSSIEWSRDGLSAGISFDKNVKSGSFNKDYLDIVRGVVNYKAGNWQIGGFVQDSSDGDSYTGDKYDASAWHLSSSYKIDKWTLKAQYTSNDVDSADEEADMLSIGADYKFAKSTKVFGFYTKVEEKTAGVTSSDFDSFAIGIEHKF